MSRPHQFRPTEFHRGVVDLYQTGAGLECIDARKHKLLCGCYTRTRFVVCTIPTR